MDEIRETALSYRSGKYTREDYAKLPEGARYQLIGGELVVAPSPTDYHQGISANLFRLMDAFVLTNDLGTVRYAPLDVQLNEKEIYQPDIMFMGWDTLEQVRKERIEGAPDLVVEILSPSTAYHDLKTKFRNYGKYGVKEYWIVDPEDQSVEVFLLEDGRFLPARRITGSGTVESKVLAGFTITLEQIFHIPQPPAARGASPLKNRPLQGGLNVDEVRETIPPYRYGKYTFKEYAKLPMGTPRQLIDGEFVVASPLTDHHQTVSSNLSRLMGGFVLENGLGTVRNAPLDVSLDDKEIYQPDIIFIAGDRVAIVGEKNIEGAPDLVVEVLSPSTFYYDIKPKFRNYEKFGVQEYWIVDPEDRSVEIFVREGGHFLPARRIIGSGTVESKVLAGFTASLDQIFSAPLNHPR